MKHDLWKLPLLDGPVEGLTLRLEKCSGTFPQPSHMTLESLRRQVASRPYYSFDLKGEKTRRNSEAALLQN